MVTLMKQRVIGSVCQIFLKVLDLKKNIQSLEKVSSQLDEIRDNFDDNLSGTNVEEVKDIISEIQGEIEFVQMKMPITMVILNLIK